MSEPLKQATTPKRSSNLLVAGACLAFFGGMIGVTYASVPLYKLFCKVTGYNGTTQRVDQASATILDRDITIRFDSNVSGDLPWAFKPDQREVKIKIGETTKVSFQVKNEFATASRGKATFNVTPELAGSYFNKLECFCFTDQTLQPGESKDMPVVFFVDPDIIKEPDLKDIKTITLSYTFFASTDEVPVANLRQNAVKPLKPIENKGG